MLNTILIVDDSRLTRKMIRRQVDTLGPEAAEVLDAESGEAALRVFESQRVDLLLTDINMPGMDGFEFLTILSRMAEAADTIKVVVSSIANDAWAQRLDELGVKAVLAKPFTPEQFTQAMRQAGVL